MNELTQEQKVLKIGKRCIHIARILERIVKQERIYRTDRREVILMAVAKGYAMVRRPGCMPYVAPVEDLAALTSPPVAASL